MNGKKTFVVPAVATALGITSAAANDTAPDHEDMGGAVMPCNLAEINPAYHPKIFANPGVAASYGFVRARDGTWQVRPGCRR